MRGLRAFFALSIILLTFPPSLRAERDPLLPQTRISGRAAGLGGAGIALSGAAESLVFNPAGLVPILSPEIAAGFGNQDLGDLRQGYILAAVPLIGKLVTGAGAVKLAFPRSEQADFDAYYFSLAFPLSHNGRLMAGFNVKFLRQEIAGLADPLTGGGLDLGFLYDVFQTEEGMGLQLGAAIMDAQTTLKSADQEILLPVLFRLGGTWQLQPDRLLVFEYESQSSAVEYLESFQVLRAGFEQRFQPGPDVELQGRFGYLQRLDQSGLLTLGVGAAYGDWSLAYAFQLPFALTDAFHTLSFSWGYNRQQAEAQARETRETRRPVPPPVTEEEKTKSELFSALDAAANIEEDYELFEAPRAEPTPEPASSRDEDFQEAEEEEDAYAMPVPEGPAAGIQSSLGINPEMPAMFSGQFSGSRGSLRISRADLRLHVVVNPFSPNGDGRQDRTIFVGRTVSDKLPIQRWILTISRSGQVVRYFKGGSQLPRNLEWDGKSGNGKKMRDGEYLAMLRVMDENDMELASATQAVHIRTQSQPISFQGPGSRTLTGAPKEKPLQFTFPDVPGSSDWRFDILSPAGKKVYGKSGGGQIPEQLLWKPTVRGRAAPAGGYTARLRYRDEAGLGAEARADFEIQYAAFGVTLGATPTLFKPQGAGGEGVSFSPSVSGGVRPKSWRLTITSGEQKKQIRAFSGKGRPPQSIKWDGKTKNGKPVPGGAAYRALLTVTSALGTKASGKAIELQCDVGAFTGEKALSINLLRVQFPPDSANLTDKAKRALATAAETVGKYDTDYLLQIIGHGHTGEFDGKVLALSRARAQAVSDFFQNQGQLPAGKIQAIGRGETRLLSKAGTEAAAAKNRRVEVVLYAK